MPTNEEILTTARDMWDTSSTLHSLYESQWAENKKLANSQHLTKRTVGRSNLFIPKTEQYIYRKVADKLAAYGNKEPAFFKPTIDGTKEGARILEAVVNDRLNNGAYDWRANVINAAYDAYTYNFAPAKFFWNREVKEVEVEMASADEEGNPIVVKTTEEVVTKSHPSGKVYPPEDFRIDPSVAWDEVGQARFYITRDWVDKAFAENMANQGLWPDIDDSEFGDDPSAAESGSMLKTERALLQMPYMETLGSVDNGLIEVWEIGYYEDLGNGLEPVIMTTLQDRVVLEEPAPIEFDLGELGTWPVVVGTIFAEPHEMMSRALPQRVKGLQVEVNTIRNQRRDNVSLILNREKYVTPNAGVDLNTLSFSLPGKVNVVRSQQDIWWDTPPDVTASSYNEEVKAEQDMDKLVAESAQRAGTTSPRKETATAASLQAESASQIAGFDATMFEITFVHRAISIITKMIQQAEDPEVFIRAATFINSTSLDPYLEAVSGRFELTVGAGAAQVEVNNAISNASNIAAITASTYGPNANFFPILKPMYEAAGINPEDIVPNPKAQEEQHDSQVDLGGVEPDDGQNVQPRAALQGGGFGAQQGDGSVQ